MSVPGHIAKSQAIPSLLFPAIEFLLPVTIVIIPDVLATNLIKKLY